ncbi:hypothetical protein WA538_005408 [Blastocystis sp. DL]
MSVAIDITKDDNNNIQSITEYRGYSLQSTCSTEENYFIGKEFTVLSSDSTNNTITANVTASEPFLYVELAEKMRVGGIRCSKRLNSKTRYPLSELNCTYFRQPLFGMENQTVPIMNTTYVLLAGDGTYVLPHWNDVVSQRCEDCSCDLNVGYTARRQFWTSNLLYTSIIVVVCSLDLLWKYIKHKWQ